jgi:hypothetical protein
MVPALLRLLPSLADKWLKILLDWIFDFHTAICFSQCEKVSVMKRKVPAKIDGQYTYTQFQGYGF